jgi:hypothetical protein
MLANGNLTAVVENLRRLSFLACFQSDQSAKHGSIIVIGKRK